MFKQLQLRLTFVCTAITGVILIAMACGSLAIAEQHLAQRGQISFKSDVNAILYHIGSQNVLDHAWLAQTETSSRLMIDVRDNGKPLLYNGTWDVENRQTMAQKARETALQQYGLNVSVAPDTRVQTQTAIFTLTDITGNEYYSAAAVVPVAKGWVGLTVVKSKHDEQVQVENLRWMFGGLVFLAVVLLTVFAWFFTAWAVKPVEESRRKQIEFVSAASHELRSPLAVIQTSISAMQQATPERAQHFASAITEECVRMSRLIGDMLTLASADNSTWSLHKEQVDLETLLLTASEHFEQIAAKKAIALSVVLPDDPLPKCRCDRQRMGQVLAVLMDNAVSYTPKGGRIELSAELYHRGIQLKVADNGVGIPDEHKAHIFDRFYRADASRSKKEHYGLGLCVAKEIVNLHHGMLTIADTPGGGATFILTLPCET